MQSVHDAGWHTPAPQMPLAQSFGSAQRFPLAHLAHASPPQSTSVSVPFRRVSVQVGHPEQLPEHVHPETQSD
jgi:hypothetical protein